MCVVKGSEMEVSSNVVLMDVFGEYFLLKAVHYIELTCKMPDLYAVLSMN